MSKENKKASEAMQRDWSMREIKEKEYQEILKKAQAYDKIMSADSSEAMEMLEIALDNGQRYTFEEHEQNVENLKNYILKSQATEKELAELKKKVRRYFELDGMKTYTGGSMPFNYWLQFNPKEFKLLKEELCKGSK